MQERPPRRWEAPARAAAGVTLAGGVAALGAAMLGEYELGLGLSLVAGPLLGLVVAEVALSVGRSRHPVVAGCVAALGTAAFLAAGWIDAGRGLEPIKTGAWLGALGAGVAATARVALSRPRPAAARLSVGSRALPAGRPRLAPRRAPRPGRRSI